MTRAHTRDAHAVAVARITFGDKPCDGVEALIAAALARTATEISIEITPAGTPSRSTVTIRDNGQPVIPAPVHPHARRFPPFPLFDTHPCDVEPLALTGGTVTVLDRPPKGVRLHYNPTSALGWFTPLTELVESKDPTPHTTTVRLEIPLHGDNATSALMHAVNRITTSRANVTLTNRTRTCAKAPTPLQRIDAQPGSRLLDVHQVDGLGDIYTAHTTFDQWSEHFATGDLVHNGRRYDANLPVVHTRDARVVHPLVDLDVTEARRRHRGLDRLAAARPNFPTLILNQAQACLHDIVAPILFRTIAASMPPLPLAQRDDATMRHHVPDAPPAPPLLRQWTPTRTEKHTTEPLTPVATNAHIVTACMPRHIEHTLARALAHRASGDLALYEAEPDCAGLDWYDALPKIVSTDVIVHTTETPPRKLSLEEVTARRSRHSELAIARIDIVLATRQCPVRNLPDIHSEIRLETDIALPAQTWDTPPAQRTISIDDAPPPFDTVVDLWRSAFEGTWPPHGIAPRPGDNPDTYWADLAETAALHRDGRTLRRPERAIAAIVEEHAGDALPDQGTITIRVEKRRCSVCIEPEPTAA